jgi:hypothetical protein
MMIDRNGNDCAGWRKVAALNSNNKECDVKSRSKRCSEQKLYYDNRVLEVVVNKKVAPSTNSQFVGLWQARCTHGS